METRHKNLYETPEAEVTEVKLGPGILSGDSSNSASRDAYDYYDLDANS